MSAGRGRMLSESETAPTPFVSGLATPGGLHNHPPAKAPVVPESDDEGAHLGLDVWHSPSGFGTFHYRDVKGYRVTAGLPRAASADLVAFHEEFASACRRENLKSLHFGMNESAQEFLPIHPCGESRARWHVGDLPLFDLARWHEEAAIPVSIRAQTRRAQKHGVTVTHWPTKSFDPTRLHELLGVRDAWLRAKPLPPLVFLTTPYLFKPWPETGVFVAERHGTIVGFLVGSCALFGTVFRIDAVARIPDAPNGTAELLVREAFRVASCRGMQRGTLGLAPLSQRSNVKTKGWWGAVSWCARRYGRGVYSFAGLEAFKAKFEPDAWVPLYAVAPGRRFTPRDVLAVARVFVGGSIVRFVLRSMSHAMGRIFQSR
jgi:phosphatidylglycerol lysyltransferase